MHEINLYLPGILLSYSAFLVGVMSPGPNVLAVIGTSMEVNRMSGVSLAMGVAAGSFSWSILTICGLSALLTAYAPVLFLIKIAGGVFLLWLAFKSLKAAATKYDIKASPVVGEGKSYWSYFRRGYLIQMTNPKAMIVWVAIISLGLKPGAPFWVGGVIVVGTFALSILVHLLYAVAFSTPVMVRIYGRARRMIQAGLGVFFTAAGLRLLLSRS